MFASLNEQRRESLLNLPLTQGRNSYLHRMDTTVQADGKISIPKELHDALGLNTGTVMDLQQQAGALVARKKTDPDVFEKWRRRGQLPAGVGTDEYLRLTRDGNRR